MHLGDECLARTCLIAILIDVSKALTAALPSECGMFIAAQQNWPGF